MTTVEALKSIFVALGGSSDMFNATTIPEALAKIATVVPSVELPAVTAADNGKVLKVVEGAWAVGTDDTAPATE